MQLLWSLIAPHTFCPLTHCSGRLPLPQVLLRLAAQSSTQLLGSPSYRRASLITPPSQVLLKLIQPYTRVRLPFISDKLNIPEKDVEQLLVSLILDNRISGYIDQV